MWSYTLIHWFYSVRHCRLCSLFKSGNAVVKASVDTLPAVYVTLKYTRGLVMRCENGLYRMVHEQVCQLQGLVPDEN